MRVVFLGAANPEVGRMIRAVQRTQPNFDVHGFLDNDPAKKGTTFLGYPVFGGFEMLDELALRDLYFVNLITGSTVTRYETSRYLAERGCRFANFVHPSVDLTMSRMGVGNYIQEGVIIQADVHVGDNSSVHMAALVGHETRVGNSVFIAHGVSISGCVTIEDGCFIGTHATIVPRVRVGRWSVVGAGSVILKDVPPCSVVVGNPGKVIKQVDVQYPHADVFDGLPPGTSGLSASPAPPNLHWPRRPGESA